jgi:hypothetical protein
MSRAILRGLLMLAQFLILCAIYDCLAALLLWFVSGGLRRRRSQSRIEILPSYRELGP